MAATGITSTTNKSKRKKSPYATATLAKARRDEIVLSLRDDTYQKTIHTTGKLVFHATRHDKCIREEKLRPAAKKAFMDMKQHGRGKDGKGEGGDCSLKAPGSRGNYWTDLTEEEFEEKALKKIITDLRNNVLARRKGESFVTDTEVITTTPPPPKESKRVVQPMLQKICSPLPLPSVASVDSRGGGDNSNSGRSSSGNEDHDLLCKEKITQSSTLTPAKPTKSKKRPFQRQEQHYSPPDLAIVRQNVQKRLKELNSNNQEQILPMEEKDDNDAVLLPTNKEVVGDGSKMAEDDDNCDIIVEVSGRVISEENNGKEDQSNSNSNKDVSEVVVHRQKPQSSPDPTTGVTPQKPLSSAKNTITWKGRKNNFSKTKNRTLEGKLNYFNWGGKGGPQSAQKNKKQTDNPEIKSRDAKGQGTNKNRTFKGKGSSKESLGSSVNQKGKEGPQQSAQKNKKRTDNPETESRDVKGQGTTTTTLIQKEIEVSRKAAEARRKRAQRNGNNPRVPFSNRPFNRNEVRLFDQACTQHGWGEWEKIQKSLPHRTLEECVRYAAIVEKKYPDLKATLIEEHEHLVKERGQKSSVARKNPQQQKVVPKTPLATKQGEKPVRVSPMSDASRKNDDNGASDGFNFSNGMASQETTAKRDQSGQEGNLPLIDFTQGEHVQQKQSSTVDLTQTVETGVDNRKDTSFNSILGGGNEEVDTIGQFATRVSQHSNSTQSNSTSSAAINATTNSTTIQSSSTLTDNEHYFATTQATAAAADKKPFADPTTVKSSCCIKPENMRVISELEILPLYQKIKIKLSNSKSKTERTFYGRLKQHFAKKMRDGQLLSQCECEMVGNFMARFESMTMRMDDKKNDYDDICVYGGFLKHIMNECERDLLLL